MTNREALLAGILAHHESVHGLLQNKPIVLRDDEKSGCVCVSVLVNWGDG